MNQDNASLADSAKMTKMPAASTAARERVLKIEESGDSWSKGIKPKIRMCGSWLERAGFKAGQKVRVVIERPGEITLRPFEPSKT